MGDLTFTRVVTAGGASIMIGASPWVIPPAWHLPVIEFREQLRPRRLLTLNDLLEYDIEIRQFYHQVVDAILHPAPPSLQNTDGDPIELTTVTYELGVTAADAFERLRPLATLRGELHVDDEVRDSAGAIAGANLTWIKAGNRKHKDWDNTVPRHAAAGSATGWWSRSTRRGGGTGCAKEITKRFGRTANLVETSVTDVVKELEARRAGGTGIGRRATSPASDARADPRTRSARSGAGAEALGRMDRHKGPGARKPDAPTGGQDAAGPRAA